MNTAMLIERILEDYVDESLMLLNEAEIDEKELRKTICDIRDKNYRHLKGMDFDHVQFNKEFSSYATIGFENLLRLGKIL